MRIVLDTNILVSSLLSPLGRPASIYSAWRDGRFTLVTCERQIDEIRDTLHKPYFQLRIRHYRAGRLINQIRSQAELIESLPRVERSPDPTDDFLLALCEAGNADYLVTGDKHGLLSLGNHKETRIIASTSFAASFENVSRAGGA